ncbi:MAG: radical SAM protein [Acidobacteria bacterium]|nr:radical SAM protein [Acidobacteriota bacterium]
MRAYLWPEYVVWETTLACNMNCLHCGSRAGYARQDELNTTEAFSLIDQLLELGAQRVILSGGETLLRPDWFLLASRLLEGGAQVGIISNGILIHRPHDVFEKLLDLQREYGMVTVGISIDGLKDTHERIRGKKDGFRIALEAVDMLLTHDFPVVVLTTVNCQNLPELRRLRDEVIFPRRLFAWQVQTTNKYGRMEEHTDWFLTPEEYVELCALLVETRRLRPETPRTDPADCIGYFSPLERDLRTQPWRGCQAGLRVLGIQSNGNIKGCLSLLDDCFVDGNIRHESLREIWDRPGGFAYNREFTPDQLTGMCAGCEHGRRCAAGCRAVAHSVTGTMYRAPYCLHGFFENQVVSLDASAVSAVFPAYPSSESYVSEGEIS